MWGCGEAGWHAGMIDIDLSLVFTCGFIHNFQLSVPNFLQNVSAQFVPDVSLRVPTG